VKKIVLLLLFFVTTISLFGCSKQISNTAYNELITNLEKMGFNIIAEDVEEDIILQGQRKWLTINENENISVYLYESSEKMEEDASYIHIGGTSYKNIQISWVSYPHFFKKDNIIVLYVGEDLEIINALKEIVGSQFAGYLGR
jgi:type IV pilus biogenesis protein CpaD/CtpE